MAFCNNCGKELPVGANACPNCGAAVQGAVPVQPVPVQSKDAQDNKAMGIIAYIGPLAFVSYFAGKDSPFSRFHGSQGLTLFIIEAAWGILASILSWILLMISWRLYWISSVLNLVWILFAVLSIIGIVNASKGEMKELPIIGKFKIFK